MSEETRAHINTTICGTCLASIHDLSIGGLAVILDSDHFETLGSWVYVAEHWEIESDDEVRWFVPLTTSTKSNIIVSRSSTIEATPAARIELGRLIVLSSLRSDARVPPVCSRSMCEDREKWEGEKAFE